MLSSHDFLRQTILLRLFAACLALSYVPSVAGQDEPDEEEQSPYAPGLVMQDQLVAETIFVSPTVRQKSSKLEWSGFLESDLDGAYRIGAKFVGVLRIELNGKLLLQSESATPKNVLSEPIQLEYDLHQINVRLQPKGGKVALTTFWSGPSFRLEPIPALALFHERNASTSEPLDHGRSMVRIMRCESCHEIENHQSPPLSSPSLQQATKYIRNEWLESFFDASAEKAETQTPLHGLHRRFDHDETRHLIAWLGSLATSEKSDSETESLGDRKTGSELFHSIGCLACHRYEDIGSESMFGGGNLTKVASKRKRAFFVEWLRNPERVNANHRMPQFDLTDDQVTDLAAFLAASGSSDSSTDPIGGDARIGEKLAIEHQCLHCHSDSRESQPERMKLDSDSDWGVGCLNSSDNGRPNYSSLERGDAAAAERYLKQLLENRFVGEHVSLVLENNCLGCHQRGDNLGITPTIQKVAATFPSFVDVTANLKPPALNSVGDKFKRNVLVRTIMRQDPTRRSWLTVQMPKFRLSDSAVASVADYFVEEDRVPTELVDICHEGVKTDLGLSGSQLASVGGRLVTSDGFGCTSCHAIGKAKPSKLTPANQLGPSLTNLQSRFRKSWFDRWVRNPARITPKMEMPSVQIAVPNVLDSNLDAQLNAVWTALNAPRFTPPDPSPTRIVRQPEGAKHAVVLTDVLQLNGRKLIKPFLIGLPNRQNLLFDLETARLAATWHGDAARQRTQGKTWFWEPPSIALRESAAVPDIVLYRDDKVVPPIPMGQSLTEPDAWTRIEQGIELRHRLRFPNDSTNGRTVHVQQRVVASGDSARRSLTVEGLEPGELVGVRSELESSKFLRGDSDNFKRIAQASGTYLLSKANGEGVVRFELEYQSNKVAQSQTQQQPHQIAEPRTLDVMPGFRVQRLPLRADVMPISLAWTPSGQLVVGSLKGRVWLGKDTNRDGLEDELKPIGDDLAAPYGLHAEDNHIDALTKFGVVRMHLDDSGHVARHEMVASGWGHTDDYHDWVVGLPRDSGGNYYVSIPCQQDDRAIAAARFRGTVVRLKPRTPTLDNPRRYEIEQVSAGHRFPMGIAMNRQKQIFVTDNQGNWNPYNELNHVVEGAHFGFINKLQRRDGFAPKLTPPAINIPHPWTRSVNGICFLDSPKDRTNAFGPFEGHIVGCEYDTRRLIRMTLEEVDGQIQGAAYPLAESGTGAEDSLQGPVNCSVAPDGSLYIANIRDSGWGGANNTGSLVRVIPDFENLPSGIRKVTALRGGFRIEFTRPVDCERAENVQNYSVSSVRRVSTPVYGGDDVDRRAETVTSAKCDSTGSTVELSLATLRAGFVYEFRLKDLSREQKKFYPSEAFYTLHRIPAAKHTPE